MASRDNHFSVRKYTLKQTSKPDVIDLTIDGERTGKPSKRLSLKQSGLKVRSAAIHSENKNKIFDYDIDRINHLPTFGEVRLHTKNLMYPGTYKIQLTFSGKSIEEIKAYLRAGKPETQALYWPSFGMGADTEIIIA